MATTKSASSKKSPPKKAAGTVTKVAAPAPVVDTPAEEALVEVVDTPASVEAAPSVIKASALARKKFDMNDEILVISGCASRLSYHSSRNNGFVANWPELGSYEYLPFAELVSAAATQPKFYTRQWWILPDEVLVALRMDKYYQGALSIEEYETIFEMPLDAMLARIEQVPDGQRNTLMLRALQMVQDGEIDSMSRILALEQVFGVSLRAEVGEQGGDVI